MCVYSQVQGHRNVDDVIVQGHSNVNVILVYYKVAEELERVKQDMEDRGSSMTDGGRHTH